MEIEPVKPSKFYRKNIEKFARISMEDARRGASRYKKYWKRMPQRLLGPTEFWEQFPRQANALETAAEQSKKETVCTFVYQKQDGFREFIVAHPEVYWWYTARMPREMRCSYEVIPEGEPCRLYFDLEFNVLSNESSDGPKMTETTIKIFSSYVKKYWGLTWDERNVVNLDSSTSSKFSRHLVFCDRDVAFRDNSHVGSLVKGVCREIEEYLENSELLHDVLSHYRRRELESLFVETGKGKKLFVDTAVYSRNRHFRTYKSTKLGKMSHLEIASDSKHVPSEDRANKDLAIFLDSLVSYFPNKKRLALLEIRDFASIGVNANHPTRYHCRTNSGNSGNSGSRYRSLDNFILDMVKPGKIRVTKQNDIRKTITYEIIGNRYCENIGREHKSNNVYWIADLSSRKVYQRCHDEDCANFTSAKMDMPPEIAFHLDNQDDELFFHLEDIEEKHSSKCS